MEIDNVFDAGVPLETLIQRVCDGTLSSNALHRVSHASLLMQTVKQGGSVDQVRQLVTLGVNVATTLPSGKTALDMAIENGEEAIVDVLLAAGAEFNTQTYEAMREAVREGYYTLVEKLVRDYSAPVNDNEDTFDDSLLDLAVIMGESESLVETLVQHEAELLELRADGKTVLLHAIFASAERKKCANFPFILMRYGADITRVNVVGSSALHIASIVDNVELMTALRDLGADVNAKDDDNMTPLHLACEHAAARAVRFLLENGAKVHVRDKRGRQPIHLVADTVCAQLLLDAGAVLHTIDAELHRPLHMAAQRGDVELVKWLLEHGASADCTDKRGYTAFQIAKRANNTAVAELLESASDAAVDAALHHPPSSIAYSAAAATGAAVTTVHESALAVLKAVGLDDSLIARLCEFVSISDADKSLKVLYVASRDGFGTADFQSKCYDMRNTVVILRESSCGYLFGFYTRIGFDRKVEHWAADPDAFLFTLTNPHGIPPTKFPCKEPNYAMANVFEGVLMRIGRADLQVWANCNTGQGPYDSDFA